jgi:hypothetical protein
MDFASEPEVGSVSEKAPSFLPEIRSEKTDSF